MMSETADSACLIVYTTCDCSDVLRSIARELVEKSLAACCQISGPVASVYSWQGQTEVAEEYLCSFKTTRRAYPKLEAELLRLHPYDEPEIVALEINAGSAGYLSWLATAAAG